MDNICKCTSNEINEYTIFVLDIMNVSWDVVASERQDKL